MYKKRQRGHEEYHRFGHLCEVLSSFVAYHKKCHKIQQVKFWKIFKTLSGSKYNFS